MPSHKIILFITCLFLLVFVGCTQATPTPAATNVPPSATATAVASQTPTFTPSPEPTPTLTPTPTALTAADIFDLVSPAVAFVDTPAGSGSGVLIADGYVLTNAHVVWPFLTVRLVFADGTEFTEAPVFNVDLLADLAILGPIETDIMPVSLVDGEDRVIGSDVYLVGYPGEVDQFPQPTITRGLISRLREWESVGITYFQSDAAIAGGQSGGVLIAENGDVIGISGFRFTEAGFAVVASAVDIWPRVQALMAGEDVARLGEWRLPRDESRTSSSVILHNAWEDSVFIIHASAGADVELKLTGDEEETYLVLADVYGYPLLYSQATDAQVNSATTDLDAPYFVRVFQNLPGRHVLNLKSNVPFTRFQDEDDNRSLVMGRATTGRISYPGDLDFYLVHLEAGERVNIQVDSILVDPQVSIMPEELPLLEYAITDDDSGGGIFGFNAELTYETPQTGFYIVLVESAYGQETGGYILTMDVPYPGAPTPIAPTATPRPIESDVGGMRLYTNSAYGFSFEYPAEWTAVHAGFSLYDKLCQRATACFEGSDSELVVILIEDLKAHDLDDITADEYLDITLENIVNQDFDVLRRETIETQDGLKPVFIVLELNDGAVKMARMVYLFNRVAYNITYLTFGDYFKDLEPMIEHSFKSFSLE